MVAEFFPCRTLPTLQGSVFQDVGRPETESNDRGAQVDLSVGGVE